ncbi:MAG TPA: LuxR C-terminal-related transcriptional regulator, partial [Hyphomicrobiaceae bacterium]|nr:LuxR C-terminal-related transcriptional regulator [Hyphomicrobiaceae bacterium]
MQEPNDIKRLALIIDALDRNTFAGILLDLLAGHVSFDSALIVTYRPTSRPHVVLDRLNAPNNQKRLPRYVAGAYLLDPFYNFALQIREPALVRLKDIAPGDFQNSDYFITYYKTSNVTDEINYLIPDGRGSVVAISLERVQPHHSYSEAELETLSELQVLVTALVGKHAQLMPGQAEQQNAVIDAEHTRLKSKLARFGTSRLTQREHEVLRYLISGQDTNDIADEIGISRE